MVIIAVDNNSGAVKKATMSITISPATNPIAVTATQSGSITFSTSAQNKAFTAATGAQGTVTYSIASQKNSGGTAVTYFTIPTNTTASLTAAASTPVGTYTITITASAAGNTNYNSGSKTITYTLTVGKANVTCSTSMSGYTYGGTKPSPSVSSNPGSGTVTYYYNTSNSTSGGTAISGATSSTYTIGSGLVGKYIYVVVSASKTNYTSTSWSDITDACNKLETGELTDEQFLSLFCVDDLSTPYTDYKYVTSFDDFIGQ